MPKKTPGTPKEPITPKRVRVTLGDTNLAFLGKVNIQKGVRTTAPTAPKFSAPIKTTLDTWSADTDKAVTLYESIVTQEAALEQSYTSLGSLLVQVGVDRAAFLNSLQNVCLNEADAQSFGANVIVPGKYVDPVSPSTIRQINTDVPGVNKIRWLSEDHAASYMVEASVDPPTPTSFSNCYTGRPPFFIFTGTPGQKVWFRLCSVGKQPSPWSAPILVVLR